MFQSLVGRLKTTSGVYEFYRERMFQSLVGRLKTPIYKRKRGGGKGFQSLVGRLKTLSTEMVTALTADGFNPS